MGKSVQEGFELDRRSLEEARTVGRALAEELGLEQQLEPFAASRWDGLCHGAESDRPELHLDDVSDIPFLVDISGVEEYQHRARLRAGEGDLFAAVTPVTAGYEEYCQERLGLGRVSFVEAVPANGPLAVAAACGLGSAFERLVEVARREGGLLIHPYMGIAAVWDLARRLRDAAQVSVQVLAPPPPVTWIANDKASFESLVQAVVGEEWLVESRRSRRPPELAASLLELAEDHRRVALKRLRCASAMGNLVVESDVLRDLGRRGVEAEVEHFLERTEWDGREEVLAVAWEETDLSPSTQIWIPPSGGGPPRLDGIYEQILTGEGGVFVGSRPAGLPESVCRRLAEGALAVAAALQELGYVGRCSFDHLVLGDVEGSFVTRFTECNGRWGGTSTPMSLLDRLFPEGRPRYRAQDFIRPELVGVSFGELLERVGPAAYDRATGEGRFVFYNVGPLSGHGKIDVVAVGESQEAAEASMLEELPALLGLPA